MNFEFSTSSKIIFGWGKTDQVIPFALSSGKKALLVTGRSQKRASDLKKKLNKAGVETVLFKIESEPTIENVSEGSVIAKESSCDFVIGLGGGSVIDGAKAIAALITNHEDLIEYLEVVGNGKPLTNKPATCIAIPTTAGTGAEVTKNSVIKSTVHNVKVSLRNPDMVPDLSIIDPELTCSMPPDITAATGLDALTQLMESYVTKKNNPLTDSLCLEGIIHGSSSLLKAYQNGNDRKARESMAIASLFGGLTLANSGLGAVHGFAAPIGGMFAAPHGVVCASLLPNVMEVNVRALKKEKNSFFLNRYNELGIILTGSTNSDAEDGINWIKQLCLELNVKKLSDFGINKTHIPEIVEKASKASSMKGNPLELSKGELSEILEKSIY